MEVNKEQIGSDFATNQFSSFSSGQPQKLGKPASGTTVMAQDSKLSGSNNAPPRQRKKSGGKASLGNKSMRMGNLATTNATQRSDLTEPALNNAAFHQ